MRTCSACCCARRTLGTSQTLDAVVLASAGKMRLDAPDYVFVLGLAEGEFPLSPSETGL